MKIKLFKILLTISIITLAHAGKTCKQFKDWKEAQAYFDNKKPGYKSLDRNHDGKACNGLYKKISKKKKNSTPAIIKIYQYGNPNGYGQSFSSMKKCEKERAKLTKTNKGLDYSYKCESK